MKPVSFLFLSTTTGLLMYLLIEWGEKQFWFGYPSFTTEIIVVSVLTSSAIYSWLFKTRNPHLFINFYLLSIVMKLIFYSTFLLIIRIINPPVLNPNAVLILVCYVLFTVLEVSILFFKVGR